VSPSSDAPRPAAFTRPDQGESATFKNGSSAYPAASGTSTSAFERPLANPQQEPAATKPRQTFAVPSVSATLGPTRRLEPLSNAFRPAPPVAPFVPAAEVIPEPVAAPETARAPEPPPASASNLYDDLPPLGGLPALSSESGLDRPMEDAVADLLRPLLKTWLAENMPKIVERALRREMSERLLPGQKNPRT
jgi:cell pole-organizing protein PopZ